MAVVVGIPALKLKGYYLAMATLGFGIIVAIVFQQMDWLTGGPSGLMGIPSFRLAGVQFDTPRSGFFLVWFTVGLILLLSLNIVDSRLGRALRAIHDSETAALAMGIDSQRLKLLIFVVSALYASLAGSLLAHTVNFIAPSSFGFMFSIKLVTMVVVGGMASIWGSLLGAAVLTILPELLAVFHDLEVVIFGLILMIVMIFHAPGTIPRNSGYLGIPPTEDEGVVKQWLVVSGWCLVWQWGLNKEYPKVIPPKCGIDQT